jgi:FHA domain
MDTEEKNLANNGGDTDVSDEEIDSKPKKAVKWADIIPLDSKRLTAYECFENEITIGRNSDNKLMIDDKRLSGTHCKLEFIE